jgi:hypothetical protein
MSGTTTNHAATSARYIAATEYGSQIFSGERSEYGIYKFADPHRQMTYEHHETRFKKMRGLKTAYDKQEFLRRIRADMKREYLTRKKQMKRLQMDAAVDFRNAENELQEHFSTEAADHPYIHGIDINAPLISQIRLPNDQVLDLKKFDEEGEFAKVRQIHADLLADQQESIRQFEQEEQRQNQYHAIWQQYVEREYGQRRPYEPRGGDGVGEEEIKTENRWECHDANCSTCGHDDDNDSYKGDEVDVQHGRAFTWAELVAGGEKQQQQPQQQQQEDEQAGRYGDGGYCGCGDFECSDCFSYGGDENDDRSSYDSDYCAESDHYPREYNWERECREAEEAAAAQAAAQAAQAEQQHWEENTRDSDGETWDEEARANEAEHRHEVAQMRLNDDMTYTCDDHPDIQWRNQCSEESLSGSSGKSDKSTTGQARTQKEGKVRPLQDYCEHQPCACARACEQRMLRRGRLERKRGLRGTTTTTTNTDTAVPRQSSSQPAQEESSECFTRRQEAPHRHMEAHRDSGKTRKRTRNQDCEHPRADVVAQLRRV